MSRITVIDEAWPFAGMVEAYRDAYLSGYAPRARQRGMTLEAVLLSPPLILAEGGNRLTFVWSLPDAAAFWAMRFAAYGAEQTWWEEGAAMAHSQTRSFHADFGGFDGVASISLINFRGGGSAAEKDALVDRVKRMSSLAAPAASALIASDLPPNRNGGDVIWRMEFESDVHYEALVTSPEWISANEALQSEPGWGSAESFTFEPLAVGERGEAQRGGLYRLLVLTLDEGTPIALREQFEAEMAATPAYISTIQRWNFARVRETAAGSRRWDYLWEQEFADISGFRGEYMLSPYHWGYLDRWYDGENPARIVDPYVGNSFCEIDAPVMFTRWTRPSAAPFDS